MMRQIGRAFGLWLLFTLFLQAGAFDFVTLHQAKEAYEKGDFAKAARLYESLASSKGDGAWLNAGDAWYKKGAYQKALEAYRKVRDPALQFQKWHNLGNTYAHLGKIDEGIKAYEKALSIKKDADTQYNLDLLKKLKRKKKNLQREDQNRKGRTKQDQKSRKNRANQKNSHEEKGKSKQNRKQKSSKGQQKRQENHQESRNEDRKKAEDEKSLKRDKKKKSSQKSLKKASNQKDRKAVKETPISDMELRKYERALERRYIQTLMLPMPTKESKRSNDEIKPW